jgi:hypothetical protein
MLQSLKTINDIIDFIFGDRLLILILLFTTFAVFHVPLLHILHSFHYMLSHDSMYIRKSLLIAHIALAIPPTFMGPLLFISAYRKAYPHHHRFMGKLYVIGCLGSAVTILPLALTNSGGIEARIGFSVMAVLWYVITWLAYTSAIRKDFVSHRRWMMRTYAMTFAFVHVNFTYHWIGVYEGFFDPVGIKVMQSMVSWMSGLFFVEIYLAATAVNGRFLGVKKWLYNMTHHSPYDRVYWRMPERKKKDPERVLGT